MQVFYNLGILLFGLAVRLASAFNSKAKLWVSGRKNWRNSLPHLDKNRPVYWFHCASLGEFDQGLPMMHGIRQAQADAYILVTFFSPSGMQHYHKRQHPADHVCYLPLDTPSAATFFVNYFKPEMVFFVKYEFWTNYLRACNRNSIPVFNLSGLFRTNQRFFKWYGFFFRKTLRYFNHFFVQNEASAKLLRSIGISNVTVSGDSRYDRVMQNKENLIPQELIEQFTGGSKVFIAGSTWPEDDALLLPLIHQITQKVIIAPHQIDKKHVDALCKQLRRPHIRYSELRTGKNSNVDILVLDSIGQLTSAYYFGSFAYVGGGFSGKLHNILEPAAFGLPILFGPKYDRFPEAGTFIKEGFAFSVSTQQELMKAVERIQQDNGQIHQNLLSFMDSQRGVNERVMKVLMEKNLL